GRADGRLRVAAPVQRRGAQGLDRPPTPRPPADVHRRAAGRGDRRRPDQARRTGAGVRVVDPGPAASLPERAQGDRHQAHPDRRDPDRRGPPVAQAGDLVRREGGPGVRRKKGAIEKLYTAQPRGAAVVCLDEMGPESAKSFPGQEVTRTAGRAKQAADYGRRGKGYVFGAFIPASGVALTQPYTNRTTANWIDFLERVERWIPAEVGRVYAVLDNLPAHRGTDALLFSLAHPRWEF